MIVGDGTQRYSFDAFFPAASNVRVGQSVNFVGKDWNEAHTATFGPKAVRADIEATLFGSAAGPVANPRGVFPSDHRRARPAACSTSR